MNLFYVQNSKDQNRHLYYHYYLYTAVTFIFTNKLLPLLPSTHSKQNSHHSFTTPMITNYVFVTDDGIVVARVGVVGDEKEGDKRYVANASIEVKTTSE